MSLFPDVVRDIELLDDSSEFDLIKNLFLKIDWVFAGLGEPVGKDFNQIVWYCENLGTKNYKEYIPILHTMGKVWVNAERQRSGKNAKAGD